MLLQFSHRLSALRTYLLGDLLDLDQGGGGTGRLFEGGGVGESGVGTGGLGRRGIRGGGSGGGSGVKIRRTIIVIVIFTCSISVRVLY